MKAFYILPLVTAIACESGQKMESEVICADQENGTASLWYLDNDGDGFGREADVIAACVEPAGYVATFGDCDDDNELVYPDAEEVCDEIDNNCDGVIDIDAVDVKTFFQDADSDGFGNALVAEAACEASLGFVDNDRDCDDLDDGVHPDAEEICDGVDNNCDGEIADETDEDLDGFLACEECDDQSADVHPLVLEICDGLDNNCDGTIDEDAVDRLQFYMDGDSDGFGDANAPALMCELQEGYSTNMFDCDDTRNDVHPGASEVCDNTDNDCNFVVDDEAVDANTYYVDADGDGYGYLFMDLLSCDGTPPTGYVVDATDCNDFNDSAYPGAPETCDGYDNDCDGSVDDDDTDVVDAVDYFSDSDGDGYGGGAAESYCQRPNGYSALANDCDDTDPLTYPGAPETCDTKDNNCNNMVDEGAIDGNRYYFDGDGDGFGLTALFVDSCDMVADYVVQPGDCNDLDSEVFPGAAEMCDGLDNNCDGTVPADEVDGDGDTFLACAECDDGDSQIHPLASEVCDDVDNNCDGIVDDDAINKQLFFADNDGDGFGSDTNSARYCQGDEPSHYITSNGDCDDSAVTTYPGAPELCDEVDNDCNGTVDDGVNPDKLYYPDADDDGFGDSASGVYSCSPNIPIGFVLNGSDCDDTNGDIYPNAPEICDGLDNDCSSSTGIDENAIDTNIFYSDVDGDGFGDENSAPQLLCGSESDNPGFSFNNLDCNDSQGNGALYNPDSTEDECDGEDYNCDGEYTCSNYGSFVWVDERRRFLSDNGIVGAKEYCENLSTTAVYRVFEPVSVAQTQWVMGLVNQETWIGVVQDPNSPSWPNNARTWVYASDGSPVVPAAIDWRSGEPNNYLSERCVVITPNDNQWNDVMCHSHLVERRFWCELVP